MNLLIENGNFFVNKIFIILVLFSDLLWWIISFILRFKIRLLNIVVKIGFVVNGGIVCNVDLMKVNVIILNVEDNINVFLICL